MSIADRKEREKEQRRNDIINAAEKLFFSRGYDNVSMNDIANEVELNKATLYLYFKNKDSLFFAVILRGLRIMRDMFRESVKEERTGLDRILAISMAFFKYCREHPDQYELMCYARSRRFDMSQVDNAMDQMLMAMDVIGCIYEAIKKGADDGTILSGIDPMEMAVFVMTNCENAMRPGKDMQWALDSRGISPEKYLEHSLGLMIHAISSRKDAIQA